jgi:hypothetical protein
MAKRNEVTEEIKIGQFSDFPEWQEVNTRLVELKAEHARLESRATEVQGILNRKADTPRLTAIARAALALITKKAASQEEDVVKLQEELQEIRTKRPHYEAAIKMQADELRKVEQQLSRRICEPLVEADEQELREAGAALVEVGQRFSKLQARREVLDARQVKWIGLLRPFNFASVVNLTELYSPANIFLREVSECGAIPAWQDPFVVVPGPRRKVRIRGNMIGPEGAHFRGAVIVSEYGDHLIKTGQAVEIGQIEALRSRLDMIQAT